MKRLMSLSFTAITLLATASTAPLAAFWPFTSSASTQPSTKIKNEDFVIPAGTRMQGKKYNYATSGNYTVEGEMVGSDWITISCDTFAGNGTIKGSNITLTVQDFDFKGTINCDGNCTITSKEPVDEKNFKRVGTGQFIINDQVVTVTKEEPTPAGNPQPPVAVNKKQQKKQKKAQEKQAKVQRKQVKSQQKVMKAQQDQQHKHAQKLLKQQKQQAKKQQKHGPTKPLEQKTGKVQKHKHPPKAQQQKPEKKQVKADKPKPAPKVQKQKQTKAEKPKPAPKAQKPKAEKKQPKAEKPKAAPKVQKQKTEKKQPKVEKPKAAKTQKPKTEKKPKDDKKVAKK